MAGAAMIHCHFALFSVCVYRLWIECPYDGRCVFEMIEMRRCSINIRIDAGINGSTTQNRLDKANAVRVKINIHNNRYLTFGNWCLSYVCVCAHLNNGSRSYHLNAIESMETRINGDSTQVLAHHRMCRCNRIKLMFRLEFPRFYMPFLAISITLTVLISTHLSLSL